MPKTTTMDSLKALITERTLLQEMFEAEHGKASTQTDKNETTITIQLMTDTYESIEEINMKIKQALSKRTDEDEYKKELHDQLKQRMLNKTRILQIENQINSPSNIERTEEKTHTTIKKTAQLPKLKLPTFDGKYTSWTAFWDAINADVLNGDYAEITKFNYIIGQLSSSAKEAVAGLHASGDNLQILIDILKDRYGQPRKIIRAHVTNLMEIPSPAGNYSSLREFHNRIMGDIRSLENMSVDIVACAPFIVPIVERKLPKFFREKIGTAGQGDSFNLRKFVDKFTEELENVAERMDDMSFGNVHSKKDYVKPSRISDAFVSVANNNGPNFRSKMCPFCGKSHSAFQCEITPNEKFSIVRKNNLCENCLGPHFYKECQNKKRCHICNRFHHTCLHDYFANINSNSPTHSACAVPGRAEHPTIAINQDRTPWGSK